MKIIKNEKLIKRNGQIGVGTSIVGVIVLAAGFYLNLQRPELSSYALLCLLVGFILTQVSIYMGNRFGRSPRPDEALDAGLKGLPSDFTIYHHSTSVPHLLVGPAGVWVLMPFRQSGVATFNKNRWKMSGGGFGQAYMRLFGQEGIGRPDLEAEAEIKALQKTLSSKMETVPPVMAVMVFTHDVIEINAGEAPIPAMKTKQLKDFMRQKARERILNPETTLKINSVLTGE